MNLSNTLNQVQTGINTVTRTAADLGLGGVGGTAIYWKDRLRPALIGGVPFGVLNSVVRFGRRNVVHEYPYRDDIWVEQLGKNGRRIGMRGFLVENAAYGGGDVIAQRERLIQICEANVDVELVHPTLGRMQVSVLASSAEERWDKGRVFELNFEFITSGRRMFPGVATSTVSAVSLSCTAADEATASDFSFSVVDAIKYGAAVAGQAVSTAMAWQRKAQRLSNDATNLLNMVSSLGGNSGRYAGGRTVGGLTGSPKSTTSTNTTADLVAQGSANRASVATAGTSLTNNAAALNPADIASSAQVLASATLASSVNPADAIRLISSLADFTPNDPTSDTPIGNAMGAMQSAMGDLFRRAAAAALARASSTYQPASADDAAAIQAQVCAVLDAEITIAGDDGQDDTFNALRAMRSAVVKDMSTRGAALASITTISVTRSLPASVLAQRLYRDPSRADELVIQANPRHPAFMPLSFKALSN